MKRDTIRPRIYSSVIMPSLQTIASFDVQPRDYEKEHRDDDKYKVSHLIAPKSKLTFQVGCASAMPFPFHWEESRFTKELGLANCSLQEASDGSLQVARSQFVSTSINKHFPAFLKLACVVLCSQEQGGSRQKSYDGEREPTRRKNHGGRASAA